MFKNVLNNKKGNIEIIVWFSILIVVVTMIFLIRGSMLDTINSTSDSINSLTVSSTVEKEKPIIEEDIDNPVTPIVNEVAENSLWEEIKVEVIAGIIVSALGFGAGQIYSKFKDKKEIEIDNRLKTLNLNKYDI